MRKKVHFRPLTAIMDVLALGLAIAALAPLFAGTGIDSRLAEVREVLFGRLAPLTACLSVLIGAAAFARIMAGYRKVYGVPWRAGFAFLLSCLSLLFALQAML
jgi:hypothetical protein